MAIESNGQEDSFSLGSSPAELLPRRAPYGVGRSESDSEVFFDWRRHVGALLRYKWLIIISPLFGAALGYWVNRFIPPAYVAQATLWLENSIDPKGPEIGPIRQQELLRTYSWVALLRSYIVLDRAVISNRLYLSYQPADSLLFRDLVISEPVTSASYRLVADEKGDSATLYARAMILAPVVRVERVRLGDSVGRGVGLRWAPVGVEKNPERQVKFTVKAPRVAAVDLGKLLKAKVDTGGNFLRLQLSGPDPKRIAATLNEVVDRYLEVAGELKRDKHTELSKIVGEQLQQAEVSLREAENALESFRVATITKPTDQSVPVSPGLQQTRDPVFQQFFTMQVELDQNQLDQQAIRKALADAAGSPIPVEALQTIGAVTNSELSGALRELTDKRAELRAMRYKYTSEHPPLQKLEQAIDSLEKRSIPYLADLLLSSLKARETSLQTRIAGASRELQQIPPRMIQEARLARQVAIADNLFTVLQRRYEEARLAEVSSIPDVRILERAAVPSIPTNDWMLIIIAGGLAGGPVLAALLALLLDLVDRRVRYPTQITSGLKLPILGAIPHLKPGPNGEDKAPAIEAFRGLQLNLIYAEQEPGPLVVTVTSPGPGDGKSFVSGNLALAFADAGYPTMLIDGDVRRGALHRQFSTSQRPGLTDVLSGKIQVETASHDTDVSRLHFLPCGTRIGRAPELLGSPAMTQLLNTLRKRYSVIVVDSPPLGAGMDAYALGAATGNLLVVVRSGSTDREVAQAKLDVLDRFPVRVFGAVINDVSSGRMYGSYSYYMEGYEYKADLDELGGKKLLETGRPNGSR